MLRLCAAKPEEVRNCEVFNNSSMPRSVALVSCSPGWDGGLPQTFTLEVRESKHKHSRVLASVQHSPTPVFNMKGLKHEEEYLFIITAVNTRGTSPPVTLSYRTDRVVVSNSTSDAQKSDSTSLLSWTLFVAVILGVFITFAACILAVCGLIRYKNSHRKSNAQIVYAGPIREDEESEKMNCYGPSTIVYCDKRESFVFFLSHTDY